MKASAPLGPGLADAVSPNSTTGVIYCDGPSAESKHSAAGRDDPHRSRSRSLGEPRLKLGRFMFMRHGAKVVFFGRFVSLLRTLAALFAGANRMGCGLATNKGFAEVCRWLAAVKGGQRDVADLGVLMKGMETKAAADAMTFDGVVPESLVFLIES